MKRRVTRAAEAGRALYLHSLARLMGLPRAVSYSKSASLPVRHPEPCEGLKENGKQASRLDPSHGAG